MSPITASLFTSDEGSSISVVIPGRGSLPATDTHPNWDRIVQAVIVNKEQDPERVVALFDLSQAAGQKFQRLTERITVGKGQVYFDGVVMHSALTEQIMRFVQEEVEDWKPLAAFLEKVMTNPEPHSREQLYGWVEKQQITITQDGDLVAYKGVESDGNGGYRSTYGGVATVDGEVVRGKIPNRVGSIVEMPRNEVQHDPFSDCASGLHIGSFSYAKSYASNGCMLEVHVNPRDVVSVPNDGNGEKARVCRYRVANIVEQPHTEAVLPVEEPDEPVVEDEQPGIQTGDGTDLTDGWVCPSPDEFDAMWKRAKRRRRNFTKYATKHGPWTLVGDNASSRTDWMVRPA